MLRGVLLRGVLLRGFAAVRGVAEVRKGVTEGCLFLNTHPLARLERHIAMLILWPKSWGGTSRKA